MSDKEEKGSSQHKQPDYQDGPGKWHFLFNPSLLNKTLRTATDDVKAVAQDLLRKGAVRPLSQVPENFKTIIEELAEEFPNFRNYLYEVVLPSLALSKVTNSGIKLAPTLFLGPSGIGKTLFAAELASRLFLEFWRLNAETTQASFALVGLTRGYSSSTPGQLLRWLAQNAHSANGLFMIDEIDKAGGGDEKYPLQNALISILEPSTAKSFSDQSMPELHVDVSAVNFVFTANTLDGISDPVLSRLLVVDVPSLTPDQARHVAMRQYQRVIESLNLPIDPPALTDEGLTILSEESPRRQRLLLQLAIGRAVLEKSSELTVRRHDQRTRPSIGFM